MLHHLKNILNEKLEEIREPEQYCTVQWINTDTIEVIEQKHIRLPSSQSSPEINVSYTIVIEDSDGHSPVVRRQGRVLAKGTKQHCESVLHKRLDGGAQSDGADHMSSDENGSNLVDDLLLVTVLEKIINKNKQDHNKNGDDVHNAKCASCGIEPIRHVDRYHCLECLNYDLCGNCFEKRHHTDSHLTGHAMIRFILPNEFLGINVNDINNELTLNNLKQLKTLRDEHHDEVTCDGLCERKRFIGLRFKCYTCSDYNLCETCAIVNHVCTKQHQRDHPLVLTSKRVLPQIDSSDIKLEKELGGGAFGKVYKAIWRSKNRPVACKVIEISSGDPISSDQLKKSFFRELKAYRELTSPFILRTFAYATCALPRNDIRGNETQYMIIMELMPRGSLQNVLTNNTIRLSIRRKLAIARQIASGMRHIHQHAMIHRDIRPDNILIGEDFTAKIGDMGIARVLDPIKPQTIIGCDMFMPPEFYLSKVDKNVRIDQKLDIFTYGLTLNQLFTGVLHHFDRTTSSLTITKQSPVFYDEIISKCLDIDTKRRPTALIIEKTLELYEETFNAKIPPNLYAKMNTTEKDQAFMQFYLKNRLRIQSFVKEKFPQLHLSGISPQVMHKQEQAEAFDEEPFEDPCRIS